MSNRTDNEIDDMVDKWHEGKDPRPLHEALGMTKEEYQRWVRLEGNQYGR